MKIAISHMKISISYMKMSISYMKSGISYMKSYVKFSYGQKSRKCPFPRPYINICQGENASGSPYSCVITKMSYYF